MMNEKNLMEIDSAEENAEPRVEGAEDSLAEEKSADRVENETLEDADKALGDADISAEDAEYANEGVALECESAEPYAEDAEDMDLAFEDEDAPAENAEIDDIEELKKSFPELSSLGSVSELLYPEKYAKFRGLGLSPAEAFLATGQALKPKKAAPSSPISVARQRDGIPNRELKFAREIFTDLCDKEIQELYKKVSK